MKIEIGDLVEAYFIQNKKEERSIGIVHKIKNHSIAVLDSGEMYSLNQCKKLIPSEVIEEKVDLKKIISDMEVINKNYDDIKEENKKNKNFFESKEYLYNKLSDKWGEMRDMEDRIYEKNDKLLENIKVLIKDPQDIIRTENIAQHVLFIMKPYMDQLNTFVEMNGKHLFSISDRKRKNSNNE